RRVVTRCRPVVAPRAGRTAIHRLSNHLMKNVIAVARLSGFWIEAFPDILKNRFRMTEILPGLPIEFPQDSVFPDRQEQILTASIDQHAFENNVEIEGLCRSMLEVPCEFSGVRIQSD